MKWSGRLWGAGAALSLLGGAGLAIWWAPHTITLPAPASSSADSPDHSVPAAPFVAPPVLASAPITQAPPGVSAEQWAALRAELAQQPAELQRLARHFVFADQMQQFRDRRGRASRAELLPLAQALDAGLDERLQQREVSAGEARLIKLALLDVLVADDAGRRAAMARWQDGLARADPAATAARDAEFQRRQADLVAAWSAQPASRRDPQALERDLDALRARTFDGAR